MANIFQRWFFTPTQCRILDFIKEHKNSITYGKQPITMREDEFHYSIHIGTRHSVSIQADDMVLNATLSKFSDESRPNEIHYSFQCAKPVKDECQHCSLRTTPISGCGNFADKVYEKMLDHYVAQHGCPCGR